MTTTTATAPALVAARAPEHSRAQDLLAYLQRNPQLVAGALMIAALVLFWSVGPLFVDVKTARPLSA